MNPTLSRQLSSAWAKSDDEGRSLSLVAHAADASAVAGLLYDEWLPASVRALIRGDRSDDEGRALLRWLAASHDVGKLSPAFACQVEHLADRMRDAGLPCRVLKTDKHRRSFPHSIVGHSAVEDYLVARGWGIGTARTYAVVVGGHHGVPPDVAPRARDRRMYGGDEWRSAREEFLDFSLQLGDVRPYLDSWRDLPLSAQRQAILTGVVIISDWLASDEARFPLGEGRDHERHAREALDALALPPPWHSDGVDDAARALKYFGLPADARANPVQEASVSLAKSLGTYGLILIESAMGTGKTEAALMAAEQFAATGGHGGLFVAMPTMATSNAMFGRVMTWLQAHPDLGMTSAMLAHGKADLNDQFRGLARASSVSGIECDCPEARSAVVAHRWLSGSKKGLLANVVVGTIDQLLFMALKARHLVLRHLAFAGKVVVIDEVHAADVYMREYLFGALEWLAAYKVPVIMLSATLPISQRVAFADAYARGTGHELRGVEDMDRQDYPALYGVRHDGRTFVHTPPAWMPSSTVTLARLADDDEALISVLSDALSDGGCVAVVRNTVRRAQDTARVLREVFDGEVVLLHSGFVAQHRADLERALLDELGRGGARSRHRLIVVATQVVEQSLDVDFDLMVTDLAPVDLILQRIGRLHRHDRDRPHQLRVPRVFLSGVDGWNDEIPVPVGGSLNVYEPYDLFRSIAVLEGRSELTLPTDISTLVQAAYAEDFAAPPGWGQVLAEHREQAIRRSQERRSRAGDFRIWAPGRQPDLVGWLANHGSEADETKGYARVRDGVESIEVIVTRRNGDRIYLPTQCGGQEISTNHVPADDVARKARSAAIRLPYMLSLPGTLDQLIPELERRTHRYGGWRDSKWLSGELALELDADSCTTIVGFVIRYDDLYGLLVEKEPK